MEARFLHHHGGAQFFSSLADNALLIAAIRPAAGARRAGVDGARS